MRLAGPLFVLACLWGCTTTPKPPEPEPGQALQPAAASEVPTPRFRILSGPAATKTIPDIGELISIATEATLDLEDGTRITAGPNTELLALTHAPSLLLVTGQLHAARLPDAERGGTARIATYAGTLETTPGLDVLIRSDAQRTHLTLLRGGCSWLAADATLRIAGEALPKPTPGLSWSSARDAAEAERTLEARFRATRKSSPGTDHDHALDAALTQQHALRERSHALLAAVSPRHAALSSEEAAARPASTREYQRALVEHAQKREAQAGQLLSAAERSLLAVLARCGHHAASACAPLSAWSARFAERLAGAL